MKSNLFLAVFIACGLFAASAHAAEPIHGPKDKKPNLPELSGYTTDVMDQKGSDVLQGIIEKEDLGEKMESKVKHVRSEALKQTAYTLALQKAVQWRYGKIMGFLSENDSRMDRIFDFAPLLMHDGKVLPPVIAEAGSGFRVESDTQASSADVVYHIIKPARIVSKAPCWRDYLLQAYPTFNEADVQVGVLPENEKERKMWEQAAVEGWEIGLRQAERLYQNNLNRLARDFEGVVKFRTLAEQGMVSLPVVAEGRPGIEVQGERLSVDRKIFRITQSSFFQHVDQWEPKIGAER